jgi:1,2-diacylglycerol 3-beta-galactosyltransferase
MTKVKKNPHILFLFSDTGGGHRSAAEAIIEALNLEYPDVFTYEMVDFFLDYSPPPLNLAGPTYPTMSRMERLWKLAFETSDDPDMMRVTYAMLWPYIRLYMYRLHRTHSSTHPSCAQSARNRITPLISPSLLTWYPRIPPGSTTKPT